MDQVVRRTLARARARLADTRSLREGVAHSAATLRARVAHTRALAGEVSVLGFSPYRCAEAALLWGLNFFTWRGVMGWVIGAVVSAIVVLGYQSGSPPSRMVSSVEDDGIAVVGDVMVVKYHNIKRRYCKGTVSRWLYDVDFEVDGRRQSLWIPLGTSASPPTPLGDQYYALELAIPATARPGKYHYTATTDYSCGLFSWLEPPTARTPDMTVQLVRPRADMPPKVVVVPQNGSLTVVAPARP